MSTVIGAITRKATIGNSFRIMSHIEIQYVFWMLKRMISVKWPTKTNLKYKKLSSYSTKNN